MALSLLRASECCQAVMCSSGSYSNPQKDLTGRKVTSYNYSGKLLWIQLFFCILFNGHYRHDLWAEVLHKSLVCSSQKAPKPADLSDFIWGSYAAEVENVPRKNVDARKNPTSGSWAALSSTFLIQEGSSTLGVLVANSQIPLVSSCLQMFFIILRQTCWFMQHHAIFPKL